MNIQACINNLIDLEIRLVNLKIHLYEILDDETNPESEPAKFYYTADDAPAIKRALEKIHKMALPKNNKFLINKYRQLNNLLNKLLLEENTAYTSSQNLFESDINIYKLNQLEAKYSYYNKQLPSTDGNTKCDFTISSCKKKDSTKTYYSLYDHSDNLIGHQDVSGHYRTNRYGTTSYVRPHSRIRK